MPFGLLDRFLAPAPAADRVAFLKRGAFAHRGLHHGAVVENSRAAFEAAIAGGFGIELDVVASRDNHVFVFHDYELERLTPASGRVSARLSDELASIALTGTQETLPTLPEILALIAGKVPLLIEVKTGRRPVAGLCRAVQRALEGYAGPVAIMSFNPEVATWFRRNAPKIVRGLVITEEGPTALPDRSRAALMRQISLWCAKPDFLAYDIGNLPSRFANRQRARGLPVVTWTVRSAAQRATAKACADAPIFEVVDP